MTHTNAIRSFLIAAVATFGMTALAQTADRTTGTFPKVRGPAEMNERKPHVGLLLGTSEPIGGQKGGADYGVDVGFQPNVPIGVGIELAASGNATQQVRLMARGTYNFGGDIPVIKESYVGAAIGPVWGSEGDPNKVLLGVAPLIGFDIPLGGVSEDLSKMSLGLQAKYIIIEGSDPETMNVNAVAKYWF